MSILLLRTKFLSTGLKVLRTRCSGPIRVTSVRAFSAASEEKKPEVPPAKPKGIFDRLWGVESNTAPKDFTNRWLMLAPAFFTHMSLGSPYAWSLIADVLTREKGFVASAQADWTLMETALPLSIVFVMLGVSASVLGKWQARVGNRTAMGLASVCFGGGMLLSSAAITMHNLPLLYAGYGVLAGTAIGLAYTPPIQALMQWFPDKKGLASGSVIAGFGSGALLFTPAMQYLMNTFKTLPTYLGPASEVTTQLVDGRLMALLDGGAVEVVEALSKDLAKLPYGQLAEGLYVVGSGSTGAAEALAVMGGVYFAVILGSSLLMRTPPVNYKPPVISPASTAAATNTAPSTVLGTHHFADVNEAIRTPQFHLLGVTFVCFAAGGLGLFSVAKPMMSEVFSGVLPGMVTSAFAAKYLLSLSAANLGGRLGWAAISDAIGRRKTFLLFTFGSIPLYASLPCIIDSVVTSGSAPPLFAFIGCTVGAISIMGGTYSILPAYQADLFGAKNVGAIHGVMMIYSAAAALSGPYLLIKLRQMSELKAIQDIVATISPEKFLSTFGSPVEMASDLYYSKTLTLTKLLSIAPPGTIDPTPHLYDTTMYTLGGLMAAASLAHYCVKPYTPLNATLEEETCKDRLIEQK